MAKDVRQPSNATHTAGDYVDRVQIVDDDGNITDLDLTGAQKAEDAASASGDTGTPILAVRQDTDAALTGTDGDYSWVAVDSAGRLKAVQVPTQGSLTNRSGTITSGGTSQELAAANTSRKYLFVQNVSTGDLWVNFGTAAVTTQPSIKLMPDASLTMTGFVSTQAVNIIGATTGQAFTAKEA